MAIKVRNRGGWRGFGSLFVITETTPRLWPEFYELLLEQNEKKGSNAVMKIGLPYMRGPHMMIYKAEFASGDSSVISTRDLESIQHYMQYSQNHKNLMETGWKRQKRKRLGIPKWFGYDVYQLLWRSNRVWRLSSHSGRCLCLNKIREKRYYQFTILYWKVAKRYCSTSFHSSLRW